MEVHRQTCQKCGCIEMVNILGRAVGESDKVYVQCNNCKELVARYIIAQGGYYHHGRGFESYLQSLNRGGFYESTKDMQVDFEQLKEKCEMEYKEIVSEIDKK
jgi:hypothetical protein